MKRIVWAFMGLFLFVSAQVFAAEGTKTAPLVAPANPIVNSVGEWLAVIDAGRYDESWSKASKLFKGAAPVDQWVQALNGVRKPLGALLVRKVSNLVTKTSLPGAPDGHYIILTYKTNFAEKKNAVETVTFMQESDGIWARGRLLHQVR